MKKILFSLVFSIVLIFILNGIIYREVPEKTRQELLSEIERYKSNIKSLSIDERNHNDLKIFDSILVGNRILMLGENTHRDGQTFKAKSRLIKYLHENHDYNVVLYEAGQFDTWIMNEEMDAHNPDVPRDSIGGLGLFDFWWANEETKPLISYYLKTKSTTNPIEIGGFDVQFTGSLMEDRRTELLKRFLGRNRIDLDSYPLFNQYIDHLNLLVYKWYVDKRLDDKQKEQFLDEISRLQKAVSVLEISEESIIYSRYLHDINNNYDRSWKYESGSMSSMNYRDSLMARNLIYQIDSVYKNQKVIVWCANVHTFSSRYNKDYLPMGAYIKNKYKKASYMLDFSSYGRYDIGNRVVNKPGKLAIEKVFHSTKSPYFFIDLSDIPANSFLKSDFVSTINQGIDQKRIWSNFIDGIFYIDINRSPTYLEK